MPPPSCSGTWCLCRSERHRPRAGEGVIGQGEDPVRGEGGVFGIAPGLITRVPAELGWGAAAGRMVCLPPTPAGLWAPPYPCRGADHRLSKVLKVPVPKGHWDLGVGTGAPREGSGRSWSLAVVGGGSCSGNQGMAASQSMSSASGQRVCQGPGLTDALSSPQPVSVPRVDTTGRGWPWVEGTWEGVSHTRRWSRGGQGRCCGDQQSGGPPVDQDLDGPRGQGSPARWDGTPGGCFRSGVGPRGDPRSGGDTGCEDLS